MMIKIFALILRLLLGLFFIFSAYSKLFPVEPFEFYWVENGLANWFWAPYLTRLVIAWEFFIGITLLFNVKLKAIMLKSALFTLIGFSIYIVYLLITKGANADCGCFGEAMSMKVWPSLAKNAALIAITVALLKLPQDYLVLNKKWLLALLFIIAFASPFILNVPENYNFNEQNTIGDNYKKGEDFSKIISKGGFFSNSIDQNSTFILAFFSSTCSHCKMAAKKLSIMQQKDSIPPVKIFIFGNTVSIANFLVETKTNFSIKVLDEKTFFEYSGPILPSIYLIDSQKVIKHESGGFFNPYLYKTSKK